MGFFSNYYTKPGKGVDVNAPPKKGFFRFWELVWRKLGRLLLLNMLCFVLFFPLISMLYYYIALFIGNLAELANISIEEGLALPGMLIAGLFMSLPVPVIYLLTIVSAVIYGPAMCAVTYMLRCIIREEHAWWSDFWERLRLNFKQGLFLGLLEVLFVWFFINSNSIINTLLISADTTQMMGAMLEVSRVVTFIAGIYLLMMRNYYYMMAITFDLKIRQIIRNSALFAILGLPNNILVLLIDALILLILFAVAGLMNGFLEFILLLTFLISFGTFAVTFTTYPVIKKYMLKPLEDTEESETAEESGE